MQTQTEKPLVEYNDFLPIQMEVNRVNLYMHQRSNTSVVNLTTRIEDLERANTIQSGAIVLLFVVCAGLSIGLRRVTEALNKREPLTCSNSSET